MTWRRLLLGLSVACCSALSVSANGAAAMDMIGFYAPWDQASLASLRLHGDQLSAIVPVWISVTGPEHKVTVAADPPGHAALAALAHRPKLWLSVQNALLGVWDGAGAASFLRDKVASAAVLDRIEAEAKAEKADGLVIDLEDLPSAAAPDLLAFLAAAKRRCRDHGWTLAVTAPPGGANPDLSALGREADRVVLMAYDEHWQTGRPGPIASAPWFTSVVRRASSQLPASKLIVALSAYAYDWPANGPAAILSVPQADALAAQHGAKVERDPASGAAHFVYSADGIEHTVWASGAAVVRSQLAIAHAAGARSFALWRLGTEDPSMWNPAR
jgi:spore germination protein YaaH